MVRPPMLRDAAAVLYEDAALRVQLGEKYVAMSVPTPHLCASFAPYHGGLRAARTIAIHETRNEELTLTVDPIAMLAERMRAVDEHGVGMLTSRRIGAAVVVTSDWATTSERVRAVVLVTAGLSNAVRVGDAPGPLEGWGTINIACHVSAPLSPAASIEALSLIVEARTAAVIEASVRSRRSQGIATGTGTDCVAVMAPEGTAPELYAGKHTALGHVIGDAAFRATTTAIARWKLEVLK